MVQVPLRGADRCVVGRIKKVGKCAETIEWRHECKVAPVRHHVFKHEKWVVLIEKNCGRHVLDLYGSLTRLGYFVSLL